MTTKKKVLEEQGKEINETNGPIEDSSKHSILPPKSIVAPKPSEQPTPPSKEKGTGNSGKS